MIAPRWSGSQSAWVRRHRRVLAALAAATAVLALGLALRPDPPAVAAVVVTSADLPAGHRLELSDLALAPIPTSVRLPGQSSDPTPLVGQVLAAPMLRGEAMSPSRLVGAWRSASLPAGAVPLPVRFADPDATRWLSAGQRIDVLAARSMAEDTLEPTRDRTARVVASDATVLVMPATDVDSALTSSSSTAGQAPPVLLGVSPQEALAIASAEATSRLSYRLEPVTDVPAAGAAGRGSP